MQIFFADERLGIEPNLFVVYFIYLLYFVFDFFLFINVFMFPFLVVSYSNTFFIVIFYVKLPHYLCSRGALLVPREAYVFKLIASWKHL